MPDRFATMRMHDTEVLHDARRQSLSGEARCVLSAEAVKHYAVQMRQTITSSWGDICEIIAEESELAALDNPIRTDREDLKKSIQLLGEVRVAAGKLAMLPMALSAVSRFSQIVENYWLSVHERLKSALRRLGPRPTGISCDLDEEIQSILLEHSHLIAAATLVAQAGGDWDGKFPQRLEEFLVEYERPPGRENSRFEHEGVVAVNDPFWDEKFVDRKGVAKIFEWFGKLIQPDSVKEYERVDKARRPRGTSLFPKSELKACGGHTPNLYRVSSVIEWLSTNKDKLKLTWRGSMPKRFGDFFYDSKGYSTDTPIRRKPR